MNMCICIDKIIDDESVAQKIIILYACILINNYLVP